MRWIKFSILILLFYFSKQIVLGKECGIVDTIIHHKKIISGVNTTVNYPWFVSFAKIRNNKWIVFCGGALVTDRHIITASHCFADHRHPNEIIEKRFHAILGLKTQCSLEGKREPIRKVYVNKRYIPDLDYAIYDIALVALWKSVSYNPVCLPTKSSFVHDHGIIVGFGGLSPRNLKINSDLIRRHQMGNPVYYPCSLKQATVVIFSREECMETKYGPSIPQKTICAGHPEGGADSCDGDSGGPLIVAVNGHFELAGIISYGTGCGRKGYPGIYSDVTDRGFLSWIKSKIKYDVATSVTGNPPIKEIPVQFPGMIPLPGDQITVPIGFFPGGNAGQVSSFAIAATGIKSHLHLWHPFKYSRIKNLKLIKKLV